ncbi:SDR family NAD(P)-dependent oxidoreductase [Orrella daihaiensis]|uniref:SDR family NAD(P)-dependent oxidoreductase n=1 Tax=Orrella daihaiensis TaxID=2782176 RepID=A0ABY4AHZ6_9BURK|nr:SDR family NAD(P)-dependent oxidoreductase [Orrella daihaiensis]UOD49809.1 SDR family NAD(P)-dependent oxidoreductase [Orrella daihaiensis]
MSAVLPSIASAESESLSTLVVKPASKGKSADPHRLPVVLVTGANGLIGRALCREFVARGYEVRAAIRDQDDLEMQGSVVRVAAPDLADPRARWPLDGVDVVVHTAARVHVMNPGPDEIERMMAVNRDGTVRLARACADSKVKRLVFLSTIKVNGERTTPGQAFKAIDSIASPADPYALSKFEAEQGLFEVASQTGLQATVVRPPLVYGPDAKGNLELLERAIRRGVPLPIGALDRNRRSLISLANLVDLVILCASHPNAPGQVFLASDDHDLSTLDLARQIAKACGLVLRSVPVPIGLLKLAAQALGKGQMIRRLSDNLQVDIESTRERLHWTPPQSVEKGMAAAFAPRP